ncbi:unnamed protein product, partial [marine sediment metagenome]
GAAAERTHIIANGIDINSLKVLRQKRGSTVPPVLALIGRIVPIKDIKTFIRAISIMRVKLPEISGLIVGPLTHAPAYVQECKDLVNNLGVENNISFTGEQQIQDILPDAGLVVLSSISEGLPLVILEAFAAGIPVVATNVGASKELVCGKDSEDQQLGDAGKIVNIADPLELAEGALELLQDASKWQAAQTAAMQRVAKYYDLKNIMAQYAAIYKGLI